MIQQLLWIDNLPVPERNGAKGAVMAVFLLMFLVVPIGESNFECTILPFICNRPTQSVENNQRRWRPLMHVYLFSKGKGRELCHYDYRHHEEIWHQHEYGTLEDLETDYPEDSTEWKEIKIEQENTMCFDGQLATDCTEWYTRIHCGANE